MKKTQTGFTLIELAIVLVIIGLLLGGVLKGQELIGIAKVKNIVADFQNTQIYLYGYQAKFKALPGDDALVANHITGGTQATTPGVVGDFRIDGGWSSVTTTDESYLFWQHVRLAGLAPGSTATNSPAYIPRNADGGVIGIQSLNGFATITGMTGSFVVCSGNILGRLAKQVDVTMDDGETNTGSVRALTVGAAAASGTAAAAVQDGALYNVCMSF
jgi:prepilin-type N-terminal cleavage/methylation domain-containing protein